MEREWCSSTSRLWVREQQERRALTFLQIIVELGVMLVPPAVGRPADHCDGLRMVDHDAGFDLYRHGMNRDVVDLGLDRRWIDSRWNTLLGVVAAVVLRLILVSADQVAGFVAHQD